MSERVSLTTDEAVAVITMDDGKVNALSPAMQADLHAALDEVEGNDAVAGVVLAGRPGVFSAGFDLKVMGAGDMGAIVDMVAGGGEFVRRLFGFPKPVVAAATGHALAAGAFTLLGCDVRFGTDDDGAKFGMNEVAIGMVLPGWAAIIADTRLSNRHRHRAAMNARITGPVQAAEVGFLDEVVAAEAVLESAVAEAASFTALDPKSYAGMIKLHRGDVLDRMDAAIAADRAAISA